jgi:iron complex outermembrane recepter protein
LSLVLVIALAATSVPRDDEIVVTATREPVRSQDAGGAVTAVNPNRIGRIDGGRPLIDLADVLNRVPGVNVQNRNNYAQDTQISIRGFGSRASFGIRGVKIFVDDIPATIPDGQGQGALIPLTATEKVEVLRGPWSVGYGNAAGGIIAATTFSGMNASEAPPIGVLQASFGQNGLRLLNTRVGMTGADIGGWVSAQRFETAGARPQSQVVRDQTYARLDAMITPTIKMQWTANVIEQPDTGDPLGLTPAEWRANPAQTAVAATQFNTRKSIRHQQLGWVTTAKLRDVELKAILYGGTRDVEQFLSTLVAAQNAPTSAGGVIDLQRQFSGIGLRAMWESAWRIASLRATIGLDWDRVRDERLGFENFLRDGNVTTLGVRGRLRRDETNTQHSNDVFLQVSAKLGDSITLNAGARQSNLRIDTQDRFIATGNGDDSGTLRYRAFSPAFGVTWRTNEMLTLYTSTARGFESPTVTELAYRVDNRSGFNDQLKPARNWQWETGANIRMDALRIKLAAFRIRTADEIVQAGSSGGRSTFQNAAATTREGIEAAIDWRMSRTVEGNIAFTQLRARIAKTYAAGTGLTARTILAGNEMPAVPQRQLFASLNWAPGRDVSSADSHKGFALSAELQARSRMAADDANTIFAPGFVTVAMSATYRIRTERDSAIVIRWGAAELVPEITFALRGDNLANRRFVGSVIVNEANQRFFEPGLPRRMTVGVNVRWTF